MASPTGIQTVRVVGYTVTCAKNFGACGILQKLQKQQKWSAVKTNTNMIPADTMQILTQSVPGHAQIDLTSLQDVVSGQSVIPLGLSQGQELFHFPVSAKHKAKSFDTRSRQE